MSKTAATRGNRVSHSHRSMAAPDHIVPPRNDRYEQFVQLLVAHEPHLRCFLRSLLPTWTDVDEVMQETSLTAWRKFDLFELDTNFLAWTAAIARFEALKHLRNRHRDRLVFSDDVLDLIASEGIAGNDALEREREALERCLAKLGAPARELLHLSYQPGVKFHEVAVRTGRSVQGYYKTLQRLRLQLLECIRAETKEEIA